MNYKEFEKDWRNMGQIEYLFKKEFQYANYKDIANIINRDHEHCQFCWETISIYDDDLNEGYFTNNMYWWVCPQCFKDFKDIFQWKLVKN